MLHDKMLKVSNSHVSQSLWRMKVSESVVPVGGDVGGCEHAEAGRGHPEGEVVVLVTPAPVHVREPVDQTVVFSVSVESK